MVLFVVSFVSCIILTYIFRKVLCRSRLATTKEKPMLLGLSIFFTVFVVCVLVASAQKIELGCSVGVLIGSVLILVLGLVDDVKKLSIFAKLSGQIVVAAITVSLGATTTIACLPAWLNMLVAAIWIVALINAFNLLDIMDGLCIGISLIISIFFLIASFVTGTQPIATLFWMFSGALAAAFIYNYPPAKLYLGDSGSMLLGFMFACSALSISYAPENFNKLSLFVPVLILGLPLYDLSLTVFMRAKKSIPIMSKSNDHLVFILRSLGLSTRKILIIIYAATICFGICALLLLVIGAVWKIFFLLGIVVCLFVLTLTTSRAEEGQK